jgi:hypothetical protein
MFSALTSCDKENTPNPEVPTKLTEFNFRYDPYPENIKEYELILSQKDGKVLLDTLIATKTEHNLKIRSNDSKFDVSTITLNPTTNKYTINTYVQINPDKWHLSEVPAASGNNQAQKSKITYTNIPYDGVFLFRTTHANSMSSSWSNYSQTINYDRALPTDVGYIILPNYGKYMFTELTSAETVSDFSKASNTVKQNFNKPAGVTNFNTLLFGSPTAGDYGKSMVLYSSAIFHNQQFDLQYPQTVIQEFILRNTYTDADNCYHLYEHSGTTVPSEIDFASKADFTITNSTLQGFSIKYENDKASSYTITWVSTDASLDAHWSLYVSPDESAFNPKEYLEKSNSKMLAGKNVTTFKLKSVRSQKVKDYSHQDMLDYRAKPTAASKKRLEQYRTITKPF